MKSLKLDTLILQFLSTHRNTLSERSQYNAFLEIKTEKILRIKIKS